MMPIHNDLWQYYKENIPKSNVEKAVRFLFLSNFGYMGKPNTLAFGATNDKSVVFKNIDETFSLLENVQFHNTHADKFIIDVVKRPVSNGMIGDIFIYNDSPYLDTDSNYENKDWCESDSFNLFEANQKTGCKWAMSEFNHPFILDQAKERGLNVITIGERQNLKNRRIEILVTNYENNQMTIF